MQDTEAMKITDTAGVIVSIGILKYSGYENKKEKITDN